MSPQFFVPLFEKEKNNNCGSIQYRLFDITTAKISIFELPTLKKVHRNILLHSFNDVKKPESLEEK